MLARSLTLAVVMTAPLASQNWFQVYPERNGSAATYVSRVGGWNNQVEILAEVRGDLFAGIGDANGVCTAVGYRGYTVDENPSTSEQFDVVFRMPDAAGAPGTEIARIGPINSPTTPNTTRATVVFTTTFATPVALPCTGTWFHGVDLYAAPNWPASDGIAMYVAYYYPPATRQVGDNPRAGAPNLAWQVMGGVPSPATPEITIRMGPLVPGPVLSAGGRDPANTFQQPPGSPNYGAGGLFPDVSGAPRADGIGVLVEDTARVGGVAWVLVGFQLSAVGGIAVPGFQGRLWLDPSVMISFGSAPITAAGAVFVLLQPGSISASAMGVRLNYQAVTVGGTAGTAALTNASGVLF